jgi:hypothetical protein
MTASKGPLIHDSFPTALKRCLRLERDGMLAQAFLAAAASRMALLSAVVPLVRQQRGAFGHSFQQGFGFLVAPICRMHRP